MRDPSTSEVNTVSGHYDNEYFAWQSTVGEFGGWANVSKFADYIKPSDDVLDFGCGGGYLLKNLHCARKIGVEVNLSAAKYARQNGVEVYESACAVPDSCADVILSNNALEHTQHPLQELEELYEKLKPNGTIVFVVPCESVGYAYSPGDRNHHLYSWSPMCLGNLFTEAGFEVVESNPYIHKWPPRYRLIARIGGRPLFEFVCRMYGRLERSWFQVRAVGRKRIPSDA